LSLYFIPFTSLILLSGCGSSVTLQESGVTESCDRVIEKNYYEICYDYKYKGALFVSYTLNGNDVYRENIEERPYFYTEPTLDSKYASNYSDYTGSGYDRGHLASDASFDYSDDALNSVYSMANIIPQNPDVNRNAWIDTEYLEREKAAEYGDVEVIIGVVYSDNPEQIGESKISVPSGYYKSISNTQSGYQECFYYENIPFNVEDDSLQEHKVECSSLTLKYN
jgi:endonuclease G